MKQRRTQPVQTQFPSLDSEQTEFLREAATSPHERYRCEKRSWFGLPVYSFVPQFLPHPLQTPVIGYLLAILLPLLIVFGMLAFPSTSLAFLFGDVLLLMAVFFLSLGWGTFPGLIAIVESILLWVIFVLPPPLSPLITRPEHGYSLIILGIASLVLCILMSQLQYTRQQARNARTNLARILLLSPNPLMVVRKENYCIALLNPVMKAIFGQNNFVNKPISTVLPPGQFEEIRMALDHVLATGQSSAIQEYHLSEHLTTDKADREYYLNFHFEPIISLNREIENVIMFGVDVTQEVQSRKKIEQLLAEQNNFLDLVAHELRTPLTAIRANTQYTQHLLKRTQQGVPEEGLKVFHKVHKYLEETIHQTEFQNRLIQDLLDAARIRATRLEIHPQLCNLSQLVSTCVEMQRKQHPERTILLNDPASKEILVMADPQRVVQVMTNYLTNALKYSESTAPVEIETTIEGSRVRVNVLDQGPGLNVEQQQRIWERFYRAPGVYVRSGSGVSLGLGLYISRTLIELQGGEVGVDSTPGKGSTFWFRLPIASTH